MTRPHARLVALEVRSGGGPAVGVDHHERRLGHLRHERCERVGDGLHGQAQRAHVQRVGRRRQGPQRIVELQARARSSARCTSGSGPRRPRRSPRARAWWGQRCRRPARCRRRPPPASRAAACRTSRRRVRPRNSTSPPRRARARAALYCPPPGAGVTEPSCPMMRSISASPAMTTRGRGSLHIYQPSPSRYSAIARAALPRCDSACFSSLLICPTVRPPGASPTGSKMGS